MTVSTSAQRLLSLCPPNGAPPEAVDWPALEARLGYALPSDYQELVQHYPLGSFGGFLGLWRPTSALPTADLEEQIHRALINLRSMRSTGAELPTAVDMLVPVGGSDNGDRIYWVRDAEQSPDTWTLAVNEPRGYRWHLYSGGIAAFLVDVLSREITVPFFPKDFPGTRPGFRALKLPRRGGGR